MCGALQVIFSDSCRVLQKARPPPPVSFLLLHGPGGVVRLEIFSSSACAVAECRTRDRDSVLNDPHRRRRTMDTHYGLEVAWSAACLNWNRSEGWGFRGNIREGKERAEEDPGSGWDGGGGGERVVRGLEFEEHLSYTL